jgi:hypothetical protein
MRPRPHADTETNHGGFQIGEKRRVLALKRTRKIALSASGHINIITNPAAFFAVVLAGKKQLENTFQPAKNGRFGVRMTGFFGMFPLTMPGNFNPADASITFLDLPVPLIPPGLLDVARTGLASSRSMIMASGYPASHGQDDRDADGRGGLAAARGLEQCQHLVLHKIEAQRLQDLRTAEIFTYAHQSQRGGCQAGIICAVQHHR